MMLGLWVHGGTRSLVGFGPRNMMVPGDGPHLGFHMSSWTTQDSISFLQKSQICLSLGGSAFLEQSELCPWGWSEGVPFWGLYPTVMGWKSKDEEVRLKTRRNRLRHTPVHM